MTGLIAGIKNNTHATVGQQYLIKMWLFTTLSAGIIFNTRRIVCEHTPQTNNATRVLKIIPVLRGVFYKRLARENEINYVTLRRGNRDL